MLKKKAEEKIEGISVRNSLANEDFWYLLITAQIGITPNHGVGSQLSTKLVLN